MACVDLTPVRAKMVGILGKSKNTGIKLRMKKIAKNQTLAGNFLAPIAGMAIFQLPKLSEAEYIEFVDQTARILHPGKRGVIGAYEPPALRKLGLDMQHWTMKVKGIGSGYWRAVGLAEKIRREWSKLALRHSFCERFLQLKRLHRLFMALRRPLERSRQTE